MDKAKLARMFAPRVMAYKILSAPVVPATGARPSHIMVAALFCDHAGLYHAYVGLIEHGAMANSIKDTARMVINLGLRLDTATARAYFPATIPKDMYSVIG